MSKLTKEQQYEVEQRRLAVRLKKNKKRLKKGKAPIKDVERIQ